MRKQNIQSCQCQSYPFHQALVFQVGKNHHHEAAFIMLIGCSVMEGMMAPSGPSIQELCAASLKHPVHHLIRDACIVTNKDIINFSTVQQ